MGVAWIGKIISLDPIEKADKIGQATVVCGSGGRWRGVVRKEDFTVGLLCEVYVEDALLPQEDRFEFMRNRGFKVRITKFLGIAESECLIMPLTEKTAMLPVGTSIDNIVGVTKFVAPEGVLMGNSAGSFAEGIPQTDEPNWQAVPDMVDLLNGRPYCATVKRDGTSATFVRYQSGEFELFSRSQRRKHDPLDNVYAKMALQYDIMGILPGGFAVQGEIFGPGILKNRAKVPHVKFEVFNVWDLERQRYCPQKEIPEPITENLDFVPLFQVGQLFDNNVIQMILNGLPDNLEGVVVRPAGEEMKTINGRRLSFKIKNPNYKE